MKINDPAGWTPRVRDAYLDAEQFRSLDSAELLCAIARGDIAADLRERVTANVAIVELLDLMDAGTQPHPALPA